MTRELVEHIYDDIDGTLITESDRGRTVAFSIDRASYEIDLTAAHAEELEEGLRPFIKVARKQKGHHPGNPAARSSSSLNNVRTWARKHGYTLSDRGRVPYEIMDAYDNAH